MTYYWIFLIFSADSSKALAALDDSKHIVTRLLGRYCNVFVTFSSHLQTDQFIVIRVGN